jgi:hypothetical protein
MSGAAEISGTIACEGGSGFNVTIRPMMLITFGLGWLAADLYLMVVMAIYRQLTRLPLVLNGASRSKRCNSLHTSAQDVPTLHEVVANIYS